MVTYYVLLRTVPLPAQRKLVFSVAVLASSIYCFLPNQLSLFASYFVIWWAGVELAREYMLTKCLTWKIQRQNAWAIALIGGVWFVQVLYQWKTGSLHGPGIYPILPLRHFLSGLIILVVSISWSKIHFRGFDFMLGFFGRFAPVAYGVYIFQWPILAWFRILPNWHTIPRVAVLCMVVICFSWVIEVHLQPLFTRFLHRFLQSPKAPLKAQPKEQDEVQQYAVSG